MVGPIDGCRCRVRLAQMDRSFDETDHPGRGMNGEVMRRDPWARRNVRSYFSGEIELAVGCVCQQNSKQVLKGDDPNLQLHEFGIGQRRSVGRWHGRGRKRQTAFTGAAFVVPPGKGLRP